MNDVIAAIATPAGEGALGIVRLSGPDVLAVAARFVRAPWQPRLATLALVHDEGRPVERAVGVYFPGPDSYTGDDVLELTAHGSPYLLSRILELAVRSGARLASPGEFTHRAYLNGRLDLAQAEAVSLLIRARTETTARAAFEQLEGRLSNAVEDLRRRITGGLAIVEASLDHPEEDLPAFGPETAAAAASRLAEEARRLAATHRRGRLAADGARVSIVGRPNAGKSSLLNALVGRDRAIVADEPGTTRDTLEETADLRGVRAVLVDTAGLRDEAEAGAVEREGIRRTRASLAASDVALVVLDRSVDFQEPDRSLLEEAAAGGRPVIVALNKADLPRASGLDGIEGVQVSALTGDGVSRLAERLADELARTGAAPEGEPWVVSLRHRLALEESAAALDRAAAVAGEAELAAVHLREALAKLGEIVGDTATEEVLRELFSRFCVGK
ncbi:MAG: tRNA uridine-5-carboxymethylaminomethyl(34) synthesis GTPase MnmE [Elusimicrobia bacterium]|nr:tRNA uridine-5-carboxymethylaminomethyl(34) synthesis GTPase MnmE [Elusimicrobiota bacterium]